MELKMGSKIRFTGSGDIRRMLEDGDVEEVNDGE